MHIFMLFFTACSGRHGFISNLLIPFKRTVEDFNDWTNWLLYKGGVGVKGEESWERWWDEEQASAGHCCID